MISNNRLGHKSVFTEYKEISQFNDKNGSNDGHKIKYIYLKYAYGLVKKLNLSVEQSKLLNKNIKQIQKDLNKKNFNIEEAIVDLMKISKRLDWNFACRLAFCIANLAKHKTNGDTKNNYFYFTNTTMHIELLLDFTKCAAYLSENIDKYNNTNIDDDNILTFSGNNVLFRNTRDIILFKQPQDAVLNSDAKNVRRQFPNNTNVLSLQHGSNKNSRTSSLTTEWPFYPENNTNVLSLQHGSNKNSRTSSLTTEQPFYPKNSANGPSLQSTQEQLLTAVPEKDRSNIDTNYHTISNATNCNKGSSSDIIQVFSKISTPEEHMFDTKFTQIEQPDDATLNEIITNSINTITEEINKLDRTGNTNTMFEYLLSLETIKAPQVATKGAKPILYIGDTDGSAARVLLLAIQNGTFIIDDTDVLKKIAQYAVEESKAFKDITALKKFQSSEKISILLSEICKNIKVCKGLHTMEFLGDLMYDRLANNHLLIAKLLYMLYTQGHILILGNHDSVNEILGWNGHSSKDPNALTYGIYAVAKMHVDTANKFQKRVFKNCHFNADNKSFLLHSGLDIIQKNGKKYYSTAFGDFQATSLAHLEEQINLVDPTTIRYSVLTNFRRYPEQMQKVLQNDDLFKDIYVVVGHNGDISTKNKNVIVVNSRKKEKIVAYAAYI